ncbi:MAG TPA: hypothetical protein VHO50_02590 [Bacteroidales bacterium]|nr:hypothetical protein [Bacteroidales bacterium]
MQKITNSTDLQEAIKLLEEKKIAQQELLMEELSFTKEKLKPSNIVRNTFNQIFTGPNLIRSVLITSLGLTAGFITKKYFQGLTGRLFRKIIGNII